MKNRRRISSRGTTVVEVMMALAMVAVGATGIVAMLKVVVVANRDARNLEIATQIAHSWVERLRADAMLWNYPSNTVAIPDIDLDTVWLRDHVQDPAAAAWFRPEENTRLIFGVHDALGRDDPTDNRNGPFCVSLRLTWLLQNKSVRAEVRVHWLRQGIQLAGSSVPNVANPLCGSNVAQPPNVTSQPEIYHAVHMTTQISRNTAL